MSKKEKLWEKLLFHDTIEEKKLILGIFYGTMIEPFDFIHAICIRFYIPTLNIFITTIGPKIL